MEEHVIAGFDPASTRNIGWAKLSVSKSVEKDSSVTAKLCDWKSGTFVMPKTEERWQVLWPMFLAIQEFMELTKPDLVIIEKTSSFAGGFVTGQVSQCIGIILAVCAKFNINVEFIYPTSAKKLVAGHGRATKAQMKKSVKALLNKIGVTEVTFSSEHASDATANIFGWLIKNGVIAIEED